MIIYIDAPGTVEMLLKMLPKALHQQKICSPCCLPMHWGVLSSASTGPHGGVGEVSSRQEGWEGAWVLQAQKPSLA